MKPIEKAEYIKLQMNLGRITYVQATELLTPVLKEMEKQGAEIAKRFHMKPPKFSVTSFLR